MSFVFCRKLPTSTYQHEISFFFCEPGVGRFIIIYFLFWNLPSKIWIFGQGHSYLNNRSFLSVEILPNKVSVRTIFWAVVKTWQFFVTILTLYSLLKSGKKYILVKFMAPITFSKLWIPKYFLRISLVKTKEVISQFYEFLLQYRNYVSSIFFFLILAYNDMEIEIGSLTLEMPQMSQQLPTLVSQEIVIRMTKIHRDVASEIPVTVK